MQAQWNYLNSDIDNQGDPRGGPSAENSIDLRRVQVSFNADLGHGWAGLVVTDFARNDAQIDQAHISKVINDATTFYAGYKKAPFSFEETAPNAKTKTVERSALNRFFIDDLNWAARVTGLQLHHKHHKQPLSYALAITNIDQNNPSFGSDDDGNGAINNSENSLAYWGRIGYDIPINEGNVHFGFDIGFMPEDAVLQYDPSSITLSDRDAWVYSLYGQLTLSQFELLVQLTGAEIEKAAARGSTPSDADASPMGISIIPSFRINEQYEIVVGYSFIDSDGVGVAPSQATYRANDNGRFWDEYHEIYLGGTYYIRGDDLKFLIGYIYAMGSDILDKGGHGYAVATDDEKINVHGLIARLQLLF